jgi:hypothetical protein
VKCQIYNGDYCGAYNCTRNIIEKLDISLWHIFELFVKSCLVGLQLHPSFNVSSPLGYCQQSHDIFNKEGYEILKFRIKCTKFKNILSYNTHSSNDWLKPFTKKKDRANLV